MMQSILKTLTFKHSVSRLFRSLQLGQVLPNLTAGLLAGVLEVLLAISYAALIFSGNLSNFVSVGIGLALFSTAILTSIVALTSSLPGSVSATQDSPAVILALIAAAIATTMPTTATSAELFLTVIAALAFCTALTGVFFLALGFFNLGSLFRFIPYPVIGGFTAGTGWLFVQGAVMVMADMPLTMANLNTLLEVEMLLRWLPGLVFASVLVLAMARFSHYLIMPSLIAAAIGLFYLIVWASGISVAEADARGWLIGPFPEGSLWQPLRLSDFDQIHWSVVFRQFSGVAMVLLISVISLLLNASVIELAVKRDIDFNRELRAIGLANLVAGLGSGIPGYTGISATTLGYRVGANSRLVGLIVAAFAGLILFLGASVLSILPKVVVGGLLLFLGLDFLVEWIYRAWFQFSWIDYLIIIAILLAVIGIGFLEGIALGVVLAVGLFVVTYSRINVVKHALSGANYHSKVERPRIYHQLLKERGDWLYILELQGFIFFGTAHKLLEQVHQRLNKPHLLSPRFILFDFRQVSGLDASAVLSFVKIKQLAQNQNITLVFTDLSPQMRHQLTRQVLIDQDQSSWRTFTDLDHGLEWCEEQLLQVFAAVGFSAQPRAVRRRLQKFLSRSDKLTNLFDSFVLENQTEPPTQGHSLDKLIPYMEQKAVETGTYLIRQGEKATGIYFIKEGRVTVQMEGEEGRMVRLRTMGAGTVVGEMGVYLGTLASASVVTNQPTLVFYLSIKRLQEIEATVPQLIAAFHKFMAQLQSERLAQANDTLRALLG